MNERLRNQLRKWADVGWDDVGLLGGAAAALYANANEEQIADAYRYWRDRRASAKASARSAIDSQIRNSSAAAKLQQQRATSEPPYVAANKRMKSRDLLSRIMEQAGIKNHELKEMASYGAKPGINPEIMRSYRESIAQGYAPKDAMDLARRYARQGRMGADGRMAASLPYNGIGRNIMMPNPELTAMQRGAGSYSNAKSLFRPENIAADRELLRRVPKVRIGDSAERLANPTRFVDAAQPVRVKPGVKRSYRGSAARGASSLGGAAPKPKSGFGWNPDLFRDAKPGKIPSKAGRMFSKFKGFRGLRGGLKAGGILGGSAVLGTILAYLANSYAHRGDQGL